MPSYDDHETAQNCYTLAYFVLPDYVFGQTDRLLHSLSSSSTLGAGVYYVMACGAHGKEPRPELIRAFAVHSGSLDDRHSYWVIQYPTPPAIDASILEGPDPFARIGEMILAPY